jgi:hypothetical protein
MFRVCHSEGALGNWLRAGGWKIKKFPEDQKLDATEESPASSSYINELQLKRKILRRPGASSE